jgi:hypothetical protein
MDRKNQRIDWLLRTGDAVAYLIITLFGFSSHGILASSGMVRLLATLLPFYASWVLFASWGDLNRGRYDRLIPWISLGHHVVACTIPFCDTSAKD